MNSKDNYLTHHSIRSFQEAKGRDAPSEWCNTSRRLETALSLSLNDHVAPLLLFSYRQPVNSRLGP